MRRDDDTTDATSRRTILEGATGAAALGAIPSTVAGESTVRGRRKAREAQRELESEYFDEELSRLLKSEGREVLEVLAAEGFLEDATLAEFRADVDAPTAAATTDDVVATVVYDDEKGEAVTRLWSRATTAEYEITLLVEPEGSARFALVEERETEKSFLVEDGTVTGIEFSESSEECEWCQTFCDNPWRPIVRGTDPESSCATTDCYREPTCDECPDQDKCDDDGGFWI